MKADEHPPQEPGPSSNRALILRARLDALRALVDEMELALAAYGELAPYAAVEDPDRIVPLKVACAVVGWKPARLKDHAARFADLHPGQPPFAWQAGGRSCPWLVHLGRLRAYLAGGKAARSIRNHQRS
ncbi:MAG: hypothetical protein K2X71_18965 [Methylobacterium sp.]|uniref:hypothetical protein n=1 Tax=Methylobacterium sp. TaxID=409 RepID=UPI00258DBBA9|nr:hypothetical protein [Methylobacterium sp.]MBY0298083.1 hypothetical protein [Methylobacterium sp.]